MRQIFQHRPMRLIFIANAVSMIGSGMNAAAVIWHVLQVTHSELSLGKLLVLQTAPALLLLPFSGVIIDREDRRYLIMLLDSARGVVIAAIAALTLTGHLRLWELYAMTMLVAAGFWMFWPTINALIQELAPDADFVRSNTMLLAGVQGGWLIAGAAVGFLYNHIGLGWILVIDAATYVVSIVCYFNVRRGRVVVHPEQKPGEELAHDAAGAWGKYWRELGEGTVYLKERPHLMMLGVSWALFLGAMLTQGVVTAPLSDRILRAGAVGYGWLNGSWGVGAFLSALYSPVVIGKLQARRTAGWSLALLGISICLAPFSHFIAVAAVIYVFMGSGRGVAGTALSAEMMQLTPKHFMGRVQNTFYLAGTILQLGFSMLVGAVAHRRSLTLAFAMIGLMYLIAFVTAIWPEAALQRERPAIPTVAAGEPEL